MKVNVSRLRLVSLVFVATASLSACAATGPEPKSEGIPPLGDTATSQRPAPERPVVTAGGKETPRSNVGSRAAAEIVQDAGIDEVMLTVADPVEAVAHFRNMLQVSPDRIDFRRALALSLDRSGQRVAATEAWQDVTDHPKAEPADHVRHATLLIGQGRWEDAGSAMRQVPASETSPDRHRADAMLADYRQDWDAADTSYRQAVSGTSKPARVLNNWGYSHLTRGNAPRAEELFRDALRQEPDLFAAKNNLVLARGAQRRYELPALQASQEERAQLMHSMALAAVSHGDLSTAKSLLRNAIEAHPRHFEEAVRDLQTLEAELSS